MSRAPEIPLAWVSRRASSPEAVRGRSVSCRCDGLIAMIDDMQPGDELRTFRSPKPTWAARAGRRGYVLVRDGAVLRVFVTARS